MKTPTIRSAGTEAEVAQDRLATVRADYDRIAAEYTARFAHELENKPLDRELLLRLAAAVGQRGAVCDLGCGPGHVAGFLHNAGSTVFGVDLSPHMLNEARRLHPSIPFYEGNMLTLDWADGALAGVAAFYSIVNLPPGLLPDAFNEMARVLMPGGRLLLSFHVGDEVVCPRELWGRPIEMEFFFHRPAAIEQLLREAGLEIEERIEREPYAPEVEHQSRRAYIFARKPGAA
jgi:SAM-dependent methyltransferase